MEYQVIQPCEELKKFVSHFWLGSWNAGGQIRSTYYSTANIQTEVVFASKSFPNRASELLFSSVQGHTENFAQFPMEGKVDLLGVSLYSYALPLLLNVSPSDLINQFVDLEMLLDKPGKMLTEKIAQTITPQNRIKVLSQYFKSQIRKNHFEDCLIINAIQHIRKHKGMVNISDMSAGFCISQKQFERRFSEYSGFNPKQYASIIRFESALWNRRNYDSLTEVAYAYGYFDQAPHFIHQFKKFAGFSPHNFFKLTDY